ncbi:ComEA family DNA-binding protein [Actinomyces sp. oral taxon 170]|uniref:ComEA family DNA-binding protein n=1 Tax=Actinomyces sp. oral taxon 170 TaxID=712117 RepID=UPI000205DBB3|nr:ComEA family DNA-binding protein [Actinomyces sp. oral taxon 170]EGF53804.1 comEA protein [Actinomyces sp. oral taxon 170 str. F0386]
MGIRKSTGNQSLDDLVRLACSADPEEPIRRPRRLAIAPRAAVVAGSVLLILALVLALRTVLASTGSGSVTAEGTSAASTTAPTHASSPATAPATARGTGLMAGPGGPTTGAGSVIVHVTGAVTRPGVVTLGAGSRIADAIKAVGGAAPDADTEQLNLARVLTDGEQIRVPRVGEVLPDPAPQPSGAASSGAGTAPGKPGDGGASGTVNINTASASELEKLPGIGPALAQRIVEYRDSHGPFASVDALTDVPGIGKAKLEALREQAAV